jgi:hypothetical protein
MEAAVFNAQDSFDEQLWKFSPLHGKAQWANTAELFAICGFDQNGRAILPGPFVQWHMK